jgi:hypothetical protein
MDKELLLTTGGLHRADDAFLKADPSAAVRRRQMERNEDMLYRSTTD